MEVYVDDMLIKSRSLEHHLVDLGENFGVTRANKVSINLAKYTFGVANRKFLGFMLMEKGIEVNSMKCKAILEMRSSAMLKEVQRLNDRVVGLSHFMSQLVEKCLHFTRY